MPKNLLYYPTGPKAGGGMTTKKKRLNYYKIGYNEQILDINEHETHNIDNFFTAPNKKAIKDAVLENVARHANRTSIKKIILGQKIKFFLECTIPTELKFAGTPREIVTINNCNHQLIIEVTKNVTLYLGIFNDTIAIELV